MNNWYHGGAPKLKKILPPNKTGVGSCASYGAERVCSRDKVYLTKDVNEAMIFAAMHPSNRGAVYLVKPLGDMSDDPDYTGPAGQCVEVDAAEVLKIVPIKRKTLFKVRKAIMKEYLN